MPLRMLVHTGDERFAFYAHLLEASGDMNELADRNEWRCKRAGEQPRYLGRP